jgi:toxin ParE1/3/4
MARVIISPSASADETDILGELRTKAGLHTAAKFRALFQEVYERLGVHPASGPPRPALGADVRIGIVSPYIVFYEHSAADDTVNVMRIIHGRRRITGRLLRERK